MKSCPFRPAAGWVPGLALAGLAALTLALPAKAAQPTPTTMPLKANFTGPLTPRFVVPLPQEIRLGTFTASGQSDLLGAVNLVEANTVHIGVDGSVISATDGVGVLTAASGDALFISYSGLPTSNTTMDFAFTITGGKGHFLGASGSSIIHCAVQTNQQTFTRVFDGTITLPG